LQIGQRVLLPADDAGRTCGGSVAERVKN
jgi:hypothetical protein